MTKPVQHVQPRRRRLLVIAIVILLVVLDSCRRPADQFLAAVYIFAVRIYQWIGRPLIKTYCVCRYLPTCSEYSIEAVQTHGIRRGLYLTAKRIASCNGTVPLGTWDPVPGPEQAK
ncbi:MAG TPA: membrane protein insertion efficiency factor YidD [Gemmataceae bacterium]|nr:membrane protein insertion efficiency factor YidD [Gemmataceae bacterium]